MINLKISGDFKSPHCDQIISIYQDEIIVPLDKGNLYLGGLDSLQQTIINKLFITSVVSVIDGWHYKQYKIEQKMKRFDIKSKDHDWIELYDLSNQSIYPYFQQISEFIAQRLEKGNVLVHCQKGRSRSASIVLAFLMSILKMTLDDAFELVLSKRSEVQPIQKFWQQLQIYNEQLKQNDPRYGSYSSKISIQDSKYHGQFHSFQE